MTAKRKPKKKRATRYVEKLTLAERVLILEKFTDGMLKMCQLELDTRVKALEAIERKRQAEKR